MSAMTSETAADQAIALTIPLLDRQSAHDYERSLRDEVYAVRDLAITCRAWQTPLDPADVLRVSDSVDTIARALRWERADDAMSLAGAR